MKEKKFEEIFKEYSELVLKYAYFNTKDRQLSQEACQQTFIRYYAKMEEIDDDMVKAWLLHTARNLIVDLKRKAYKKYESLSYEELDQEAYSTLREGNVECVAERLHNLELSGRIMGELRRVNESWYKVMELICVEEFSQEEAAELLGISLKTLRVRLFRARKYVREKFGSEYKGS